jgi:toxin ParE1/3/4
VRVKWLPGALANLDAEAEYIARDKPLASARVVQKIKHSIAQLQQYPSLGRPGRVAGTRELVIDGTPYVIPYRVRHDEIEILRVFHTARRWPRRF